MVRQATMSRPTHKVSIAGRVVDAVTRHPLAGVEVTLAARGPLRTITAADGAFRFLDLPDGDHHLAFALPSAGRRYGTTTEDVTLKDGQRALCTAALPPSGVSGKIDYPDVDPPIGASMYPLVRLEGSGEEAYGEADGSYRVLAIEPGVDTPPRPRKLNITVPGYEPLALDAPIVQGEVHDAGVTTLTASTSR
jgi:carboxypeptidase family protein